MLVLTSLLLLLVLLFVVVVCFGLFFYETSLKVVATDYTLCSVQCVFLCLCFGLSLFDSWHIS